MKTIRIDLDVLAKQYGIQELESVSINDEETKLVLEGDSEQA